MFGLRRAKTFLLTLGAFGMLAGVAGAQSSGGTTGGSTGTAGSGSGLIVRNNYHIGFERPEAWGLKYFASTSLLSGLPAPPPAEGYRFGTITVGLETDWVPQLDAGQQRIGFNGKAPQDLNKVPILVRPVIRIGLPDKFSAIVAAPPPFELFGVHAHLLAFGLERPLMEREHWTLGWRGYGQVGSVKGAFTCPNSVLGFAPGSPDNPTRCVAESADVASFRYAGSEFEFSYRIPQNPKIIPHAAAGGNFIDGVFQTHAQVVSGLDETRLWTRGGTFSGTAGVTYMVTKRAAFTVDAFYSPLWVKRNATASRTNDGLFNVRALLSYSFR
jgi:hypothetical protein